MRKLFIFFIILCSLLLISCETIGPINIGLFSLPVKWTATLQRTTDGEQGVYLEQTSDTGYVVLVEYTDTQNLSDSPTISNRAIGDNGVKLAKLNAVGEHQWTYELPDKADAYDEKGSFVIKNNYIKPEAYLIGVNKIDQSGISDIKLSYVSHSGNLIWETTLSGSNDDVIYGALLIDQYKTLVYGKTNSYDKSFDGKTINTGYDGFIFVISNENGAILERYYHDFGREDNAIKHVIFRPGINQEYFLIGETDNGPSDKIWLRKIPTLNATTVYDAVLKTEDTDKYRFGGIVEIGLNSYVLGCEKSFVNDNFLGFYGFNASIENEELIINYGFEVGNYNLDLAEAKEEIIGFTPFSDRSSILDNNSILVGTKHGSNDTFSNSFLLLNQETGSIKEQDYRYKEGVIYEYANGNILLNNYGLTGSITPTAQGSSFKRVAGGRDCWVEAL
jgi:hypothetical protein